MIKYPKINESVQRIVTILAKWFNLIMVDFDYSESINVYCEIAPKGNDYLKVRVWINKEDQLLIYEDINGGLEHKEFVMDIAKYLEVVGGLDLGEKRIEKWDNKIKEHKVEGKASEANCFECCFRMNRGFCDLLNNWQPRKEDNRPCEYWTKREENAI
ncbi:hypothetical protein [Halonatronum saccharophilum]|uniref:hypothetical protein n=1 Tax=Halonatronum saccharophilum TaxID=150060 RepID=UPI000489E26A|nr:hypothetical protein [Halonatronum saccharophilum]